jgi:hypothetical protein
MSRSRQALEHQPKGTPMERVTKLELVQSPGCGVLADDEAVLRLIFGRHGFRRDLPALFFEGLLGLSWSS